MNRELHVDAPLGEGVIQLAHLVLRLRHGHPISRNDDDVARLLEQLRRPFDRLLLPWFLFTRGQRRLCLAERAEQHVRERAIHRTTHDDRENQTTRAVERAGRDQQLAVEHESHRDRREAGIGVEDRDDGGHVGAADGNDQQHAKDQGERGDRDKRLLRPRCAGMQHDGNAERDRDREHPDVDKVLAGIGDGSLRNPAHFLQLARRHETAREGEESENDFGRERAHAEMRHLRCRGAAAPQEVLRHSHEARSEPAERVGERRALWHGGKRHARQRHADDESRRDGADDPAMMDDFRLDPRRQDGHRHPDHARNHPVARGLGIVHPVQREDEQGRRQDGRELTDEMHHCFLNILSMRSVIMKPLTMFVIEANSATAPRMRIVRG